LKIKAARRTTMNRRSFLGGVSGSFVIGTIGGGVAGAIVTGAIMYNPRSKVARVSYAHHGEDLVLEGICNRIGIAIPTYLDIGAFDPIDGSNTFLFYEKGCRGVLVEPNPYYSNRLRSIRPRDTVLNAGIGPVDRSEADYYLFANGPEWNTFSKEQADVLIAKYGDRISAVKVTKMPLLGINRVMEEHFAKNPPDLLSIDTEGLDLSILLKLDFDRFRPPVVCAETDAGVTKVEAEILTLMRSKGYSVRGQSINNAMFVDDHRWH
jgi:FkbM family methyltransferase